MNNANTNESQDLRIIKTEFSIRKAFISLLKKKPYSKISVTEIVQKAQINRNTFYLHYIDKEDLLNNLLIIEFNKYDKIINKAIDDYEALFIDISEERIREAIKSMLNDLSKDIDFYRLVMKDKDMKGYILKIKDFARSKFDKIIDSDSKAKKMCMEFCFEGAFGLFFRWIEEGDNLADIDDVSLAVSRIIYEVFKNIKKVKKA